MSKELLKTLWQSSLMEAICRRRSFRFGQGFEMKSGPWSGYRSKEKPVPLSELETAILCAVASGTTGLVTGDNVPLLTYASYVGRTVPPPCNMWSYGLFFTNDDGTYFYKAPEPTKPWEIETSDETERFLDWFRKNTIRIGDRLDIPLGPPALQSGNVWDILRPGSTVFMPVADNTRELIHGILLFCGREDRFKIIDDKTGKPAGCENWIESGWLSGPEAPLSTIEVMLCISNGVVTGGMMQNMLLTMAAMGLGGLPFDGFAPIFVLGGTPLAHGLGFRFVTDKRSLPNPVGKDGIFEPLCPPYKSMDEAVDTIVNEKFGNGGILTEEKRKIGPYKSFGSFKNELETFPGEAVACTKAILNYAYDTYGRFPVNYDTISIPIAVQAHHVDTEFYDRYISLPLPEATRNHMKSWHR